jgi:hypothetical protein
VYRTKSQGPYPIFARWKNQIRNPTFISNYGYLNQQIVQIKLIQKIVQMKEPRRPSTQEVRPRTLTLKPNLVRLFHHTIGVPWSFQCSCLKRFHDQPITPQRNHRTRTESPSNKKLALKKKKKRERPCHKQSQIPYSSHKLNPKKKN